MKRVAAYCRVSTDKDDQINSLENQKRYFQEFIHRKEEWEFTRLYIDEGISGTSIKKRTGFKEMLADAEDRKFDLLITKEISRFARNTLDSIFYTRKLKALGIGVIFLNDNINTLDPDAELRLTIMASIAQEESRKISERVKWGQKRSMERGVVFGNRVYGYDILQGKLHINPEQAKVVRLIFQLYYEEGMGTNGVAKELEKRNIPSPSGLREWSNATILKILKNEKYAGMLKQKKQITTDFLTHSREKNQREEDQVIVMNNHEPMIEPQVFQAVQNEIYRRNTYKNDKSQYSNRYVWSGRIKCGLCGARYKRKIWHKGEKSESVVWVCSTNVKYGRKRLKETGEVCGCDAKAIHEKILEDICISAIKDIIADRKKLIMELETVIERVLDVKKADTTLRELNQQMERIRRRKENLLDLYADGAITRKEFSSRNEAYNKEIQCLEMKQKDMNRLDGVITSKNGMMEKIQAALHKLCNYTEFNEEIIRELIHEIIIEGGRNIRLVLIGGFEKSTTGEAG